MGESTYFAVHGITPACVTSRCVWVSRVWRVAQELTYLLVPYPLAFDVPAGLPGLVWNLDLAPSSVPVALQNATDGSSPPG